MARQLRIQYEGAIYHLMSRGDRHEEFFRDDLDRKNFLQVLGAACEKTDWQVHAYCLMGNHFHLMIETAREQIWLRE
jgi:REP element-mobilizing transposase RayT